MVETNTAPLVNKTSTASYVPPVKKRVVNSNEALRMHTAKNIRPSCLSMKPMLSANEPVLALLVDVERGSN